MLAPYPQSDERLADTKAESDMEAVKGAIRAGRSLRASYGIPPAVTLSRLLQLVVFFCSM